MSPFQLLRVPERDSTGMELAFLGIRVRDAHPECKVLLFSGQAATANLLDKARERGYNFELLSKPIHPSDLLLKVKLVTEHGEGVGAA